MRIMSLITAVVVVAVLYLIVFERDAVRQVAGGGIPQDFMGCFRTRHW